MSTAAITLASLARSDYELIGWEREMAPPEIPGGVVFKYLGTDLRVICAVHESATRVWLHLAISIPNRLPTWEELRAVKEGFIGPNRHAVQHLPRVDEKLSAIPDCFQLWAIIEGEDPFDEISGREDPA